MMAATRTNPASLDAARALLCLTAALAMICSSPWASADTRRVAKIQSVNSTGPNDQCNEPLWGLPEPLPEMAHFTLVGEYDPTPGVTDATPLGPDNCVPDTLLATTVDPEFQGFFGFPAPDPRLTNIPLREVAVGAALDGTRSALPRLGQRASSPLPPVRSEPAAAITLGDWFAARGTLRLWCDQRGGGRASAAFEGLIPNGVYTMFGIWLTTPPGATDPTFLPVAFGGVPNAVVASATGRARFKRALDYCPFGEQPDGSILMFVDLAYHSDGALHGAFPFQPLGTEYFSDPEGARYSSTLPPGVTTHVQLGFPVNVSPLDGAHSP